MISFSVVNWISFLKSKYSVRIYKIILKSKKPSNTEHPVFEGFLNLFNFYALGITPERMA